LQVELGEEEMNIGEVNI